MSGFPMTSFANVFGKMMAQSRPNPQSGQYGYAGLANNLNQHQQAPQSVLGAPTPTQLTVGQYYNQQQGIGSGGTGTYGLQQGGVGQVLYPTGAYPPGYTFPPVYPVLAWDVPSCGFIHYDAVINRGPQDCFADLCMTMTAAPKSVEATPYSMDVYEMLDRRLWTGTVKLWVFLEFCLVCEVGDGKEPMDYLSGQGVKWEV